MRQFNSFSLVEFTIQISCIPLNKIVLISTLNTHKKFLNTKQGSTPIIRIQILCIICYFQRCHSDGMQKERYFLRRWKHHQITLFIAMLFDNFEHNDEKKNTESKLLQIIVVNDRTGLTANSIIWPVRKGFSTTATTAALIKLKLGFRSKKLYDIFMEKNHSNFQSGKQLFVFATKGRNGNNSIENCVITKIL